jgi:uncharacterized protein (TIGR02246 family)
MLRSATRAALALALCLASGAATAGTAEEVRAAYLDFAAAQNARDPARIGAFFTDAPEVLWVSDGKTFRGREAVLARMGSFQKAAVWRVEPGLDAASVLELAPDVALLHMPLILVIGPAEAPDRLGFLVSLLFRRQAEGWRIAALLTTEAKPAP